MQSDVVARRVGDGLQITLRRLASLAGGLVVLAAAIGAATFATGWWVFDGSSTWFVVGLAICLVPVVAAAIAWLLVRAAAKYAPGLITDLTSYLRTPSPGATVLIDYDTGQPIARSGKSFGAVKADLTTRKRDLPALYIGIRAITLVPGLAAIAVLGMIFVGGLGTVLLIGGLID